MELSRKHRPKDFDQVVGQDSAVKILSRFVERKAVPHALCFIGSSGNGKTTLARIVARKLRCKNSDLCEVNCATDNGIDMVRTMRAKVALNPMFGKCRVWILDECHKLSSAAQNSLLKILEETPQHAYFMLATTDPHKLLRTVRTRCTDITIESMGSETLEKLIKDTAKKEGVKVHPESVSSIADAAQGSARKALVILNQIIGIESLEEQLSVIATADSEKLAIEIARGLLDPSTSWKKMADILRGVKEDPEQLRHMVLGYCNKVLLGGGPMAGRAMWIIQAFKNNFYDSKEAGLSAACYYIVCPPRKP